MHSLKAGVILGFLFLIEQAVTIATDNSHSPSPSEIRLTLYPAHLTVSIPKLDYLFLMQSLSLAVYAAHLFVLMLG